jgi:hypothetical protein
MYLEGAEKAAIAHGLITVTGNYNGQSQAQKNPY